MQIHGLINCSGRGQAIANVSLATGRCGPGLARLRPVRRGCCARVAGKDPSDKELADKFFPGPGSRASSPEGVGDVRPDTPSSAREPASKSVLDNVNPYELGRQARRAFDDVWENISSITAPTKSYVFDDVLDPSASMEADPRAAATTVLVAGATGRVGRILIRKLLLRGYRVRALIRRREGIRESSADVEGLPAAVEVVTGDVGELADVQRAVKGVDKVIYCAAARTAFTGDLTRVDERGVARLAAAMQDEAARRSRASGARYNASAKKEVADFSQVYHQLRWDVEFVGVQAEDGSVQSDAQRANLAAAEISEGNNLLFTGALFTRGAAAQVGAELNPLLPGGEARLEATEGLTLRVKAEGHVYACVLRTDEGHVYAARFPTRPGRYSTVRLPWALFRPEREGQPPLEPAAIRRMGLRYELRRAAPQQQQQPGSAAPPPPSAALPAAEEPAPAPAGAALPPGARLRPGVASPGTALARERAEAAAANARFERFKLEVDWIKAMRSGVEPDFVLVSCSGAGRQGVEPADLARIVAAKRRGEEALRTTGLGYTIIRPGPLVNEPGGYKALVFDQGDRVSQSVSAADVADICLRALHESEARNKTFDVCYEYQSEAGLELYELVASMPSSSGNYLSAALSTLARNT